MYALTLMQPWAMAVLELGKNVENRTWAPPDVLRTQRIGIHAGAKVDDGNYWGIDHRLDTMDVARLPTRAIIGTVELAGFTRFEHDYETGSKRWKRYGLTEDEMLEAVGSRWRQHHATVLWVFRNPVTLLKPIPCRGQQGLWPIPNEVAHQLPAVHP